MNRVKVQVYNSLLWLYMLISAHFSEVQHVSALKNRISSEKPFISLLLASYPLKSVIPRVKNTGIIKDFIQCNE